MTTDDTREQAEALLATVKHLMTGAEIHACEWTKSSDFEDEMKALEYDEYEDCEPEPERVQFDDEEEFEDALEKWEHEKADAEAFSRSVQAAARHVKLIASLSIQFSREIGDWINKRNAAISRKALRQ